MSSRVPGAGYQPEVLAAWHWPGCTPWLLAMLDLRHNASTLNGMVTQLSAGPAGYNGCCRSIRCSMCSSLTHLCEGHRLAHLMQVRWSWNLGHHQGHRRLRDGMLESRFIVEGIAQPRARHA